MNTFVRGMNWLANFFLASLVIFHLSTALSEEVNQTKTAPDWLVTFRENLQHNLQFWIDHAVDRQYGGVIGRLDREGKPVPPGDKSVVLISRTMWSFAEAYRRSGLDFANHAVAVTGRQPALPAQR